MSQRENSANPGKSAGAPATPPKKPYTTPRLTVYGSIEKLTKTGGQTVRDGRAQNKSHF